MVKRAAFAAITVSVPLVVTLLCVELYFLYGYLTYRRNFCSSFATLDGEIGWIPKPATQSCIRGYASLTGPPLFSSGVAINGDGFRSGAIDRPTPRRGILAIGDSWTFGYGIEWADTFAARLGLDHGRPTALLASPAYSGAQAVLLARRHMARLTPHTIVYLELGFWDRAVCSGPARPARILKPCYWVDPGGRAELVLPQPGRVERGARLGLRPGGMMGAGESTLAYFLLARPVAKVEQLLVRLGVLSGLGDDFAPWGDTEDLETIRRAHFEHILALASEWNARLVLLDPFKVYADFRESRQDAQGLIYVGAAEWTERIEKPMASLAPREARLPRDIHYGPGTHKLIADLIDAKLDEAERENVTGEP
jgi:hypothetical protein